MRVCLRAKLELNTKPVVSDVLAELKWLDSFSMRNFTNASVFDDTLPVSDGLMEIGAHMHPRRVGKFNGRLVSPQELPAEGCAPDRG